MSALRFPFAAASGVLCTLTLFTVLFHFVSQPIDVEPVVAPPLFVFTPQIKQSPIVDERAEKPEREPPRLEPAGPRLGGPSTEGAEPARIPRHEVARPTKGGGLRVSGADRDVLPLFRVAPDYPRHALENETEGWVKVQFSINAVGAVTDAVVVESEPDTTFDEAALKAINRWRYNPRVENGVAVERVGRETVIRFEIE